MNVTKYLDCTFKPIPRVSPCPKGMIVYMGGRKHLTCPTYVLRRDKEEIVIESKIYPYTPEGDYWNDAEEMNKKFSECLTIIESLLPTIEFGTTNWAYLIQRKPGEYRIQHIQKFFKPIPAPTLIRKIDVSDVEVTSWHFAGDRRGYWKGKEVDIYVGWDEISRLTVRMAIDHYEAVLRTDLDVTFDVYGCLVKDNEIIGIVTEAAWGRPITPSDRIPLYSTIAKIQAKAFVYKACRSNSFLVSGDKIRITQVECLFPYSHKTEKLENDAELCHWTMLDELFSQLQEYGPFGMFKLPKYMYISSPNDIRRICPPISPMKPVGGLIFFLDVLGINNLSWNGYSIWRNRSEEDDHPLAPKKFVHMRRRPMLRDQQSDTDKSTLKSLKISKSNIQRERPRHAFSAPYYVQVTRPRYGLKMLTDSDDSSRTQSSDRTF